MSITFRRLQVFVAAAHDCNFRKTADRLGISQPAVSAQIREIEQQLGYPLFERRRGANARLSERGRSFFARARELVAAQSDIIAGCQATGSTVLMVSVGPVLLETCVKPALPDFYEICPEITLEFVSFNPAGDMDQALRSGAVDVLMYTGGPPEKLQRYTEMIVPVECSIYGAPHLVEKLAGRPAELSAAPFVMPPEHYHLSKWFEVQLANIGIRPRNIVARPPYMDVALQMIIAGKGLAVLFDEHAAKYLASAQLLALEVGSVRAYRLMVTGRRALRPQFESALRFLRRVSAPSWTSGVCGSIRAQRAVSFRDTRVLKAQRRKSGTS